MVQAYFHNLFKKELEEMMKINTKTIFLTLNDNQNRNLSKIPMDPEIKIAMINDLYKKYKSPKP